MSLGNISICVPRESHLKKVPQPDYALCSITMPADHTVPRGVSLCTPGCVLTILPKTQAWVSPTECICFETLTFNGMESGGGDFEK